jgi:hypothetical protein
MTTDGAFNWSALVDPVERNGHKQPLLYPHPGATEKVPYKRVTTYIGSIDDAHGLSLWAQRKLAWGLALRHDYYTGVAAVGLDIDDDPKRNKELDELIELAKNAAAADSYSTVGTALHRFAELADQGQSIDALPIEYVPDLAAYTKATEALKMKWVEPFTVCDPLGVAGTPDRIFQYKGGTYIGDIKTGTITGRGIGKIAMQLALYARSALYNHDTGERTPHGASTSRGLIIHLPAGKGVCTLYWADLLAGWEGVQLSKAVHAFRAQRFKHLTVEGLDGVGTPFEPKKPEVVYAPGVRAVDNLLTAINGAGSRNELNELVRKHSERFQPHHLQRARDRWAEVAPPVPAATVAAGATPNPKGSDPT